uniref:Uncharacterized protein n=1 Tax=Glossina austeni TaxID=7395 RepID=A0A1A9V1G4_GLOAU
MWINNALEAFQHSAEITQKRSILAIQIFSSSEPVQGNRMVTVAEVSKEHGQVISCVRPYILPEIEKIRKESCQAMVPGGATLTFLKFMFAFLLVFHTANAVVCFAILGDF